MSKRRIDFFCKLFPGYRQKLFKKEYRLDRNSGYKFKILKDGYLVYRRNYPLKIRYVLTFLRNLIKVIIEYRDTNKVLDEKLFKNLNFSKNKRIYNLDASQKKEFLKKRYIQSFKGGFVPFLPEPVERRKIFIPIISKGKSDFSEEEFFKSFESEN